MGGGMAGAITASDAPSDLDSNGGFGQANQPSAEASEEGQERATADDNVDAMANLIVESSMAPDRPLPYAVSRDQLEASWLLSIPRREVSRHHQRVAGSKNRPEPLSSLNAMYDRRKDRIKTLICGARPKRRTIAYAIEQTPEELTNVLAQLRSATTAKVPARK